MGIVRDLLEKLARGEISVAEAERLIRVTVIQEIEHLAKLDIGRELRKGIPEIILADGKSPEDVRDITLKALAHTERVIVSRVSTSHLEAIRQAAPQEVSLEGDATMRTLVLRKNSFKVKKTGGTIGILTAGTSDIPIAEEARIVAEEMGCEVMTAYDVGVAGIHRVFGPLKKMIEKHVDVIIVVAGREGALATVVAGLVDIPIIGVPTSFSWGLGEKGLSALTSMLQACPLGLTVVNIDGGVAAGAAAALISNRVAVAKKLSQS
jgi:NCAIR mutase (PurE)-related protein